MRVPIDSCASSSAWLCCSACCSGRWAIGRRVSPRAGLRHLMWLPAFVRPHRARWSGGRLSGPPMLWCAHSSTQDTARRKYFEVQLHGSTTPAPSAPSEPFTAAAERCFWPRARWALRGRRQTRCRAARRPRAAAVCAGTVIVARGPASCHCALTAPLRPPLTRLDGDRQAKEGGQEGGEEG